MHKQTLAKFYRNQDNSEYAYYISQADSGQRSERFKKGNIS